MKNKNLYFLIFKIQIKKYIFSQLINLKNKKLNENENENVVNYENENDSN
jgi:hypothetical protein